MSRRERRFGRSCVNDPPVVYGVRRPGDCFEGVAGGALGLIFWPAVPDRRDLDAYLDQSSWACLPSATAQGIANRRRYSTRQLSATAMRHRR
jgi:hypothetical protein